MSWTTLEHAFTLIRNGASIKQDDNSLGIPITRIETISNRTLDVKKMGYANVIDDKYSDFYLKDGDILMSHINSLSHLGKTALVESLDNNIIHGMNLLLLRANKEILAPNFANYYFSSPEFIKDLKKISNQSVNQCSFSISKLKDLQIPLPPLPIQKQIAEILDAADALKRKDQELLKKYDELAQAIFIDMFGDPVKNEKGWDVTTLPQITENLNNLRKPVKSDDRLKMQGKYPYYGATGIIDYVDHYTHNGELVLISEDGKNLVGRYKKVAFIAIGKFWVNNHSHVLKCKENCCSEYLEFYFNKIDISAYVTGIDQFKLNKNNLDLIPILLPPIALQKRFKIIINEIEYLKTKLISSMSENLFNSLIQKAFKGELVA